MVKHEKLLEENDSDKLFENRIWLRTDEAAEYLRKTVNAVRILVHRGVLPVRKFRRRLYFKRSELDAILNSSINYGGY
jgi:excisionase family DNA binding protein